MSDNDVARDVAERLRKLLYEFVPAGKPCGMTPADLDHIHAIALNLALDDLAAFSHRDPAAKSSRAYVAAAYRSYLAVAYYRVAHQLHKATISHQGSTGIFTNPVLLIAARSISEKAKAESGIEIHPGAEIAERFVIDHGVGTVIGETAEIGADCYFLQMVVLGGRCIADGLVGGRRHPRIGNRVQIASSTQIIGPITIGDDVIIDAGAKITTDIPSNTRVRVVHTLQVNSINDTPPIYGIVPKDESTYTIHGKDLLSRRPCLMKLSKTARDRSGNGSPPPEAFERLEGSLITKIHEDGRIDFEIKPDLANAARPGRMHLGLECVEDRRPPIYVINVPVFSSEGNR